MAVGDLQSSTTAAINPYVEDAHSSEVGCGIDTETTEEDAAEPGERDMEQNWTSHVANKTEEERGTDKIGKKRDKPNNTDDDG